MNKKTIMMFLLFSVWLAASGSIVSADFDERLWEMYSEINIPQEGQLPQLGAVSLEPSNFKNLKTNIGFSDIRILTDSRIEVPYHIITRMPESKLEELSVKMFNLSQTKENETFFSGIIIKDSGFYNAIEILTDDKNFYRQVKILGSNDGNKWNMIRGDAVIFDSSINENLRHTKISFPDSKYKHLSIKIMNNTERPLKVKGIKIFYQTTEKGQEGSIYLAINKKEENPKNKQSIYMLNMPYSYPISKITLNTSDRNFQRSVEVFLKNNTNEWIKWTDGIIFKFETDKIRESKLYIVFPEVVSNEIKLVVKNYDSPPINITGANASYFKKMLIFKLDIREKYYMFWGNPTAKTPSYDMSQLIAKHSPKDIKFFSMDMPKNNPKFAGDEKRRAFTERYKYLLYIIVGLIIVGLIVLQYKVIKRTENQR